MSKYYKLNKGVYMVFYTGKTLYKKGGNIIVEMEMMLHISTLIKI